MAIEQDIKTIIGLLEAIAGKKVAVQVEQTFSGGGLPEATTNFEQIKTNIATMSKDQMNAYFNLCHAKGVSEAQKSAITKIFKQAMGA